MTLEEAYKLDTDILRWSAEPLSWNISKIHIRWSTGRASGHNPPFSGNARQRRKQDRAWRRWVDAQIGQLSKAKTRTSSHFLPFFQQETL